MFAFVCLVALTRAYDIEEYKALIESLDQNATVQADFERYLAKLLELEPNYYDYTPFDSDFECKLEPSPQVPTSVHKLRPADIKVLGALGDSLTASPRQQCQDHFGPVDRVPWSQLVHWWRQVLEQVGHSAKHSQEVQPEFERLQHRLGHHVLDQEGQGLERGRVWSRGQPHS